LLSHKQYVARNIEFTGIAGRFSQGLRPKVLLSSAHRNACTLLAGSISSPCAIGGESDDDHSSKDCHPMTGTIRRLSNAQLGGRLFYTRACRGCVIIFITTSLVDGTAGTINVPPVWLDNRTPATSAGDFTQHKSHAYSQKA